MEVIRSWLLKYISEEQFAMNIINDNKEFAVSSCEIEILFAIMKTLMKLPWTQVHDKVLGSLIKVDTKYIEEIEEKDLVKFIYFYKQYYYKRIFNLIDKLDKTISNEYYYQYKIIKNSYFRLLEYDKYDNKLFRKIREKFDKLK